MGCVSCPVCKQVALSDVQELQLRVASALSNDISCPICSVALQGLAALHHHLATHMPLQPSSTTSPHFNETFPSIENLEIYDNYEKKIKKNIITQDQSTSFCDVCGLVFSSEHFLSLHKDIVHSNPDNFEVTCKQCGSKFANLQSFRNHVRETHVDRQYICDKCPKSFKMKGGLLVHTRMFHDQSSPSQCAICKKKFANKARKEIHERRFHLTDNSTVKEKHIKNASVTTNGNKRLKDQINDSPKVYKSTHSQKMIFDNTLINDKNQYYVNPIFRTNKLSECSNIEKLLPVVSFDSFTKNTTNSKLIDKIYSKAQMNVSDFRNNTDSHHISSNITNKMTTMVLNNSDILVNEKKTSPDFNLSVSPTAKCINTNSNKYTDIRHDVSKLNSSNSSGENLNPTESSCKSVASSTYPLYNFENQVAKINCSPESNVLNQFSYAVSSDLLSTNNDNYTSIINSQTSLHLEKQNYIDHLAPQEFKVTKNRDTMTSDNSVKSNSDNNLPGLLHPPKFLPNKTPFKGKKESEKTWECEICKKGFTTKYFLKKHKRLHTGETPYECKECSKSFTFQQSYHKHVLYHSDEKPHSCPHCGRAFKEMSTLHNHVRIHTGEKPFVCNDCGKAFRQRVSYLVHQRIHTGHMPYSCEACKRVFRYKVSLRSHKCDPNGVICNSKKSVGIKQNALAAFFNLYQSSDSLAKQKNAGLSDLEISSPSTPSYITCNSSINSSSVATYPSHTFTVPSLSQITPPLPLLHQTSIFPPGKLSPQTQMANSNSSFQTIDINVLPHNLSFPAKPPDIKIVTSESHKCTTEKDSSSASNFAATPYSPVNNKIPSVSLSTTASNNLVKEQNTSHSVDFVLFDKDTPINLSPLCESQSPFDLDNLETNIDSDSFLEELFS